jgi:hypothetical protein
MDHPAIAKVLDARRAVLRDGIRGGCSHHNLL